jgi:hypothetical protein
MQGTSKPYVTNGLGAKIKYTILFTLVCSSSPTTFKRVDDLYSYIKLILMDLFSQTAPAMRSTLQRPRSLPAMRKLRTSSGKQLLTNLSRFLYKTSQIAAAIGPLCAQCC